MLQRNAMKLLPVLLILPSVIGCAAFRPIHGIPARYVPVEFLGPSRSGKQTIDLSLLRQTAPPAHLVDTNDLLSVYVEGVLGKRDEQPPVHFPLNPDIPPTVGYPIPVRDDGTISLPLVGSLPVRGMTIRQVEDSIRRAYTADHAFLQPGRDRIFVALQQPRTFRVLVIRQEASSDISIGTQGELNIGALKRGTGKVVNLPVYKNDVLNALAETGGLPGLDAENAIYIIRGRNPRKGVPHPHAPAPIAPQVMPIPQTPPPWQPHLPMQPLPGQPLPGQPQLPPAPQSARHPTEAIIRGQSPAGFNPQADYRSQGTSHGGWSQPVPQMAPVLRTAFQAPTQPALNGPAGSSAPGIPAVPPAGASPIMPSPTPAYSPIIPAPAGGYTPAMPSPAQTQLPHWPQPGPVYAPGMMQEINPGTAMPPSTWMPADIPPGAWSAHPPTDVIPEAVGEWPVHLDERLNDRHIIRIPVRLGAGERANITEDDIILEEGDIVFIESRETEVFYTGGLLGGGQYTLPRDYDLDVLGAIAVAQGRGGGGGASRATQSQGGQSALNSDVSISASQLVILRPLPDGTQLTIQVDLYEAIRNPNERIIVQPGDYLLLQYTRCEAVMAFVERHLLEGALFGVAAAQLNQGR